MAKKVSKSKPAAKAAPKAAHKAEPKSLEARAAEGDEGDAGPAPIGSGAPAETEPVPDDMREDDPTIMPDSSKSTDTSNIKANRSAARKKRRRLADIGNVMSARL